jgi:hypothetical protein
MPSYSGHLEMSLKLLCSSLPQTTQNFQSVGQCERAASIADSQQEKENRTTAPPKSGQPKSVLKRQA